MKEKSVERYSLGDIYAMLKSFLCIILAGYEIAVTIRYITELRRYVDYTFFIPFIIYIIVFALGALSAYQLMKRKRIGYFLNFVSLAVNTALSVFLTVNVIENLTAKVLLVFVCVCWTVIVTTYFVFNRKNYLHNGTVPASDTN